MIQLIGERAGKHEIDLLPFIKNCALDTIAGKNNLHLLNVYLVF